MKSVNFKLVINKKTIFIFFLLLPVLKPTSGALSALFGESTADLIYSCLRLYNYIVIAIASFLFVKKKAWRKKWSTLIISLLSIVLVTSSIKMGNISYNYLYEVFGNIMMIFLLGNIYSGRKIYYYVEAVYYYITVLMALNSASILLYYPNGMYSSGTNTNYYLFGLDNVGFMYTLSGFFMGQLYYALKEKKPPLKVYILYALISSVYLYVGAGTGTIIIFACVVMSIFYHMDLLRKVNIRLTMLICLIAYIFIVVFQSLGIFEWILGFIGKSVTFNGRTYIWTAMFKALPEHLWTGFGISTEITSYYLSRYGMGLNWLEGIGHLHNIVLEILFRGGIVGLILFVIFWISIKKNMTRYDYSRLASLLCVQMILQWLTCMFEYRIDTYTFWLVPMCMCEISSMVLFDEDNVIMRKNKIIEEVP